MVSGHIRYSIPEEMKKGSLIGNVAQDLGLDLKRLLSGRARIVAGESIQYTELKTDKGILVVNERIDREQLCGDVTPCSFSFEVILENPMELHQITVEVTDINDHSPTFKRDKMHFEISEIANIGARFTLTSAEDPDVGINGLREYVLTENDNFVLKQNSNTDGKKYAEMMLQKPLDRETYPHLSLKLIAVDGGTPQRSGTVNIDITVLDANDNGPVFNQSVYKATVMENSPRSTYVTTVNASDADFGSNSIVTYYFSDLNSGLGDLFTVDAKRGIISTKGVIDYEKDKKFELRIEAKDQGGLTDSSKVVIEVIDVNDNTPTVSVMSFTSPVSEDSPSGTTIGIINVKDLDSGDNGQVICRIEPNAPFKIKSNLRNYYTLVTDTVLDRESVSEYNITVVATDAGMPSLSAKKTFHLKVSDVNDNSPVFPQSVYTAFITENNSPGISVLTLKAKDPDEKQNARISYILEDTNVGASPVSEYVSINAESGVIHAVRSFDYEQIRQLVFIVRAQDGGSPPLSSNVTVKVMIQDQNDNPPQVLYPVQTGGSLVAEMVPRSADVGYLVTKVVAVDVDSGQNAWLSYKLQKATDRALFEVGLQNGEIRTIRQVTDKDAVKQRLTVIVEDNGQPSRSATVMVNMAVADSFPEVLSEFTDFPHDKEYNDNLTFYLVLALAVVSFLFITCLVVIISVKIYRWRQSRILYHSSLPVIPYYPPRYSDTLGTGTLPHVYNYEVCRTTDSRKSDCKFGRADSSKVIIEVTDINDNAPIISVMSFTSPVSEDSHPGTTIGIINIKDLDSGENGQVTCKIEQNAPFKIKSNLRNYYTLVTDTVLDRESVSEYNITVVATDAGMPSLSATKTFHLKVSDVNDNAPVFSQSVYTAFVTENNSPGISVLTLKAKDPDEKQNARISYILEDTNVGASPVSEYVSINSGSGVIHAVRSFDYEQIRQLVFVVKAQDGGSPPLSSNVTVKVMIQDQNDNPPQVLYPVQTGGSLVAEMVPRSADVGYLVTKVVAVDVDSGQNAWLSYKLQKATDRALFEVGLQNGEIRTIRQVTDKDAVKQRLTVIVEDNGQPSRSATVIVNVAVADSFPEVLSEFTDFPHDKEYNDNLTFYLVLALAVVSFLFITCLVVIISVKIYRWRQSRILYHSSLPVIPYYPPRYSDTLGTGTLPHVYNYEVCRTTDSRKSDCKFGRAGSQNVLIMDPSSTGTMQRIQSEKSILDEPDSPLEVS
ncbi:protocadherin beta-11-like [Symphorus nematophorus]